MSPLDITDWKSDKRLLYELTRLAEPERLERSVFTKSFIGAVAPPPPPPPQAVRVSPAKPANTVFFTLDLIFIPMPPLWLHPARKIMCI
jgi:hypothetical protein